jgi:hypothetical protein
MRINPRLVATTALAALVCLSSAAPARAANVGIRFGAYTDPTDAFLGAEVLLALSRQVYVNPNIEYVFAHNETYMTFNADFHYDLNTRGPYVWIGAGLAVIYQNPDGPPPSTTDVGANLLVGIGARGGSVIPYVQAKLIIKSNTQFVIGAGIRF